MEGYYLEGTIPKRTVTLSCNKLLFITTLSLSTVTHGIEKCPAPKPVVFFANGMFTTERSAKTSTKKLQQYFIVHDQDKKIRLSEWLQPRTLYFLIC